MQREARIKAPPGYPLFGWSPNTIKQHLEENPPDVGDMMIIYNSHAGLHRYSLATIVNPSSGPQKRVILSRAGDSGGTAFYRNGTNAFAPKGRTVMLPPVATLMAHLAPECDVVLEAPLYGPLG